MSQNQDSKTQIQINRPLVGIIALVCLATGGGMWLRYGGREDLQMWIGGFNRAGFLMTAFWIALPSKGRDAAWANVSPWTFAGILLGILVAVRYPRTVFLPMLGLLGALAMFNRFFRSKPRTSQRPDRDTWQK